MQQNRPVTRALPNTTTDRSADFVDDDAADARRAPRLVLDVGTAAALGVVAALVSWWRLPEAARSTLWAEDGPIFLSQRLDLGPWESLVTPYAGYQHLGARLATDLAVLVGDLGDVAHVIAAVCCGVVGLVTALVFVLSRQYVVSSAARVAIAAVTVLAPIAPIEVSGNLANLHWYLLWLLFWAVLHVPRTWWGSGLQAGVVLVCALTEVQSLLLVPLVLVTVRHRRSWPVSGALLVGVAVQLWTSWAFPRPASTYPAPDLTDLVLSFLAQPVMSTFVASSGTASDLLVETSWGIAVLVLAGIVLCAGWAAVAGRRRRLWLVLGLVVYAPLLWAAGIVANASGLTEYGLNGPGWLATSGYLRYALVPSMLLLTAVALAADAFLARRRAVTAVAGAVLLAAFAGAVLWHPQLDHVLRSDYGPWQSNYDQVVDQCRSGDVVLDDGKALVPIAPTGWFVAADCSTLDERG
jgi:hypothetical protein